MSVASTLAELKRDKARWPEREREQAYADRISRWELDNPEATADERTRAAQVMARELGI